MSADAIKLDTAPGMKKWLLLNAKYAAVWPNISDQNQPAADADTIERMDGKFDKLFGRLRAADLSIRRRKRRQLDHLTTYRCKFFIQRLASTNMLPFIW